MILKYVALYLGFINLLAIVVCVIDKIKARFHHWRIPEKTLFVLSLLGGATGMYFAMILVRHKTRHKRFMITLPILILLQMAILIFVLYRAS